MAKAAGGEYRLLVLDGHNSHLTYPFCAFSEARKIIILCLPPHTTHRLQPCDVGVFGPLASSWRKEVNDRSARNDAITFRNFLRVYSVARSRSVHPNSITSAWEKAGLWPVNPNRIEDNAYEPAKLTTSQSAQPIPATLPGLLTACDDMEQLTPPSLPPSASTSGSSGPATPMAMPYCLTGRAAAPPRGASVAVLLQYISTQNAQLDECTDALSGQHAQMRLMDRENGDLRQMLFTRPQKSNKRTDLTDVAAGGRHMTAKEVVDALAYRDWQSSMKAVFAQASPIFKQRKQAIGAHYRAVKAAAVRAEAAAVKAAATAETTAAVQAVKRAKAAAKKAASAERKAKEEREKTARKAQRAADKVVRDAKKLAEEERKADAKEERKRKAAAKSKTKARRATNGKRKRASSDSDDADSDDDDDSEEDGDIPAAGGEAYIAPEAIAVVARPPPKPRPVTRASKVQRTQNEEDVSGATHGMDTS
jgi:hypothetical protein